MEKKLTLFLNPFTRIAGWQSLIWGMIGIVVATVISYYSQYHYHGLLHFGPAPNNTFACFAIEHLVVWLIPSLLFWVGGLIFSKSRIRVVDVFGTVAFAQLPFIIMNLVSLLPPMQKLNQLDPNLPLNELMEISKQPDFLLGVWVTLFSLVFFIWGLVWMFGALKVSTNLKGNKLGIIYCIGIFGGDVLCRLIISSFY